MEISLLTVTADEWEERGGESEWKCGEVYQRLLWKGVGGSFL